MALDLTAEQKDTGRRNFEAASGELTRRGFMKSMAAGAAVVPLSAAVYYGYDSWKGNKAVKTALIGSGDEGGVLIGDHNPEFLGSSPSATSARPTRSGSSGATAATPPARG
jgi:hypothetical protein